MMVQFQHPYLLLLVFPVLLALVFVIRRDFAHLKGIQQRSSFRAKVRQRTFLLVSRSLIFSLLIVAIASPFTLQTFVKSGDPTLKILIDNSSSMAVFDTSGIPELEAALKKRIPVVTRTFSSEDISAVGDALITAMDGDDNVLLVSDGNSNYGRSLGDMLVLASSLNSTVNALQLSSVRDDTAVSVSGPRITTNAEENEFNVVAHQVGKTADYRLIVSIDGEEVLNNVYSGSNIASVSKKFAEGYHVIKAQVVVSDYFPQNNVYFKSVKVEPSPRILHVSRQATPISSILSSLYHADASDAVPADLSAYSALVIDNIPAPEIDAAQLSSYVVDGNGLVVFGGKNSYDRGGYKDSLLEGMLPVRVGKGSEGKRTDVNIALVIDISGSTGAGFSRGSGSSVEEVEKALAIGIIDELRKDDKVAVVAFNTEPYIVAELVPLLGNENYIKNRIERLVYKGGTRIDEGLKAAAKILGPLEGSRNIIVFSDGRSASQSEDVRWAQIASNAGIKVYAVGVGEGTNSAHMQDIAKAGSGYYFEPDETQRLAVLFGESEDVPGTGNYPLEIVNSHHFVTSGLKLSASVNGFNQVVPKPNADLLVATQGNNPVITASRLGLGRVVAVSTDSGSGWAPELVSAKSSVLLSRSINWAVGDLSRNKEFDVDARDVFLGDRMEVNVISGSAPSHDELKFAKIGKRLYSASFVPEQSGLYRFFDATAAVNYEREYLALGVNPELEEALGHTGGSFFTEDDVDAIVEKVKADSRRIITTPASYSWLFMLFALIIFLAEIAVRRLQEEKNK